MNNNEKQKKVFTIAGQVSIVVAVIAAWFAINSEENRFIALIVMGAMIFDAIVMFYMATADLTKKNKVDQG